MERKRLVLYKGVMMSNLEEIEPVSHGGRPLRDSVTNAINDAVIEEICCVGFGRLSVEAVARRAGVGKAAIYRRWPSREEMLQSVISDRGLEFAQAPDTGSLKGDVAAYLRNAARTLSERVYSRLMPHIYAEIAINSDFGQIIRAKLGDTKRMVTGELVKRAIARGELAPHLDDGIALDLLAGPIFWSMLVEGRPLDASDLQVLTDAAVAGLVAASGRAAVVSD